VPGNNAHIAEFVLMAVDAVSAMRSAYCPFRAVRAALRVRLALENLAHVDSVGRSSGLPGSGRHLNRAERTLAAFRLARPVMSLFSCSLPAGCWLSRDRRVIAKVVAGAARRGCAAGLAQAWGRGRAGWLGGDTAWPGGGWRWRHDGLGEQVRDGGRDGLRPVLAGALGDPPPVCRPPRPPVSGAQLAISSRTVWASSRYPWTAEAVSSPALLDEGLPILEDALSQMWPVPALHGTG